MKCGVIEQHLPLHKRESTHQIRKVMLKYKPRILWGFLTGNYQKYFYPLSFMKNYYGEKYAFEYAFLLHYQAWLYIPSLLGICLVGYQGYKYYHLRDFKECLDSEFNGIFGLFVALWATCFVESWKRQQRTIQFMWNTSDKSYSKVDEREDDFKYYNKFNPVTKKIEKEGSKLITAAQARLQRFSLYFIILLVIMAIMVYRTLILTTKGEYDNDGNLVTP